jgi:hypothetical protein
MLTAPEKCVHVTFAGKPAAFAPAHTRDLASGYHSGSRLPSRVGARAAFAGSPTVTYPDGRVALFEPVLPPDDFGADQMAVPLVRLAKVMSFRTIVSMLARRPWPPTRTR